MHGIVGIAQNTDFFIPIEKSVTGGAVTYTPALIFIEIFYRSLYDRRTCCKKDGPSLITSFYPVDFKIGVLFNADNFVIYDLCTSLLTWFSPAKSSSFPDMGCSKP